MDLVFAPSQIESWPIDRLRPYARNAKIHGDDQVAKIAASMAKFGWTVPCMVADDGELIAGHGRVLAATMLGLTEVPVIRLSHLDHASFIHAYERLGLIEEPLTLTWQRRIAFAFLFPSRSRFPSPPEAD
jgi:hypothetical protein